MSHFDERTEAPVIARIVPGLSDLAPDYDVILCDVWGVLHNGQFAFSAAVQALTTFRARGGTVVLITNAPRPRTPVQAQLDLIGVSRDCYDALITSGDVTLAAIQERGDAPAYHIGPPRDLVLFEALDALGAPRPRLTGLDEASYVVATGLFGDERDTPDIYDPTLAVMRARGLDMICANPDLVVHIGDRLRYCAGAVAARYHEQGGRVIYAGKPHGPIYDAALGHAARIRGRAVDPRRVLAIGDALRTDVAGAVLQGLDVLFVTAGIHRDESHRTDNGRLDPDAYQRMIEVAEHRPLAAIEALTW